LLLFSICSFFVCDKVVFKLKIPHFTSPSFSLSFRRESGTSTL
jgi:hypothetical protein